MTSFTRMLTRQCIVAIVLIGHIHEVIAADPPAETDLLKTFVAEFVTIAPGQNGFPTTFLMGSLRDENEQPMHLVSVSHPFRINRYETWQALYEQVMGYNPSRWTGPRNSVEQVTWQQAQLFCRRVTRLLHERKFIKQTEVVRLPTEAEWEYCCRAGTATAYTFGSHAQLTLDTGSQATLLDLYGWHTGNAAGNDPPVGALLPNRWGLYDMHGYVWEMCQDQWMADYRTAPRQAHLASQSSSELRVIRGGSWQNSFHFLTCSKRAPIPASVISEGVGFRCVIAEPTP